jgi:hypothetical protein
MADWQEVTTKNFIKVSLHTRFMQWHASFFLESIAYFYTHKHMSSLFCYWCLYMSPCTKLRFMVIFLYIFLYEIETFFNQNTQFCEINFHDCMIHHSDDSVESVKLSKLFEKCCKSHKCINNVDDEQSYEGLTTQMCLRNGSSISSKENEYFMHERCFDA